MTVETPVPVVYCKRHDRSVTVTIELPPDVSAHLAQSIPRRTSAKARAVEVIAVDEAVARRHRPPLGRAKALKVGDKFVSAMEASEALGFNCNVVSIKIHQRTQASDRVEAGGGPKQRPEATIRGVTLAYSDTAVQEQTTPRPITILSPHEDVSYDCPYTADEFSKLPKGTLTRKLKAEQARQQKARRVAKASFPVVPIVQAGNGYACWTGDVHIARVLLGLPQRERVMMHEEGWLMMQEETGEDFEDRAWRHVLPFEEMRKVYGLSLA